MIVIDIGARYKNYDADMTRMVFVGKATRKIQKTLSNRFRNPGKIVATIAKSAHRPSRSLTIALKISKNTAKTNISPTDWATALASIFTNCRI